MINTAVNPVKGKMMNIAVIWVQKTSMVNQAMDQETREAIGSRGTIMDQVDMEILLR
jgi:hypothetical protein